MKKKDEKGKRKKPMTSKRLVVTGGHLTPALAVIDEFVRRGGWEIHFIGHRYASEREKTPSVESRVIPEKGIIFYPLSAGRFPRLFNRYVFWSAAKLPLGFLQALYYLVRIRPRAVLSFGGYLSVPVVFWSWILRIPSLTHEQTTVSSLATKINALFVKKIAVSWAKSLTDFPKKKTVFTGNPIRKDVFKVNEKLWQIVNFPEEKPTLLVTGGNQGAQVINEAVRRALPTLLKKINVMHLSGHLEKKGDYQKLQEARKALEPQFKKSYHVKKYVSAEEIGTFMAKSDLVLSRGGMNTLAELVALGKPALIVPYPWQYKDEQTENALMLVEAGMAEILPQSRLSEDTLKKEVEKMLGNLAAYRKNAQKAKKLIRLDAAERIADEAEKLL